MKRCLMLLVVFCFNFKHFFPTCYQLGHKRSTTGGYSFWAHQSLIKAGRTVWLIKLCISKEALQCLGVSILPNISLPSSSFQVGPCICRLFRPCLALMHHWSLWVVFKWKGVRMVAFEILSTAQMPFVQQFLLGICSAFLLIILCQEGGLNWNQWRFLKEEEIYPKNCFSQRISREVLRERKKCKFLFGFGYGMGKKDSNINSLDEPQI